MFPFLWGRRHISVWSEVFLIKVAAAQIFKLDIPCMTWHTVHDMCVLKYILHIVAFISVSVLFLGVLWWVCVLSCPFWQSASHGWHNTSSSQLHGGTRQDINCVCYFCSRSAFGEQEQFTRVCLADIWWSLLIFVVKERNQITVIQFLTFTGFPYRECSLFCR